MTGNGNDDDNHGNSGRPVARVVALVLLGLIAAVVLLALLPAVLYLFDRLTPTLRALALGLPLLVLLAAAFFPRVAPALLGAIVATAALGAVFALRESLSALVVAIVVIVAGGTIVYHRGTMRPDSEDREAGGARAAAGADAGRFATGLVAAVFAALFLIATCSMLLRP